MDLALQLYSARDVPPGTDVLAIVAACGYTGVEGFDPHLDQPHAFRARLDRHRLAMASAHVALDRLETDPGVVAAARILGLRDLYAPYLDPRQRPGDSAGWTALGQRLAGIGARLADAGLGFGWHNHGFELARLADGSTPLDRLLDAAPGIAWEADVAWILRAGGDPLDLLRRHGHRIRAVHVKDIAQDISQDIVPCGGAAAEQGWADVGHGSAGWERLAPALRDAGIRRFIVEHDAPSDFERFARRSGTALRRFLAA